MKTEERKTLSQITRSGLKYGKGITLNLDKEERSVVKYLLHEISKKLIQDTSGIEPVYGIPGPTTFGVALFPYEVEALKRVLARLTEEKVKGGR